MEQPDSIFWIVARLLGSLALLIYGMKKMSETLQKMAGPQLRQVLGKMTTNRFTGMLTGVVVTAAVQSSTATTVMTVSFVNAGLLTLAQAISVIMGANIGTTLTAWIMSAGFAFSITNLVWPGFLIAIVLIYRKKHEDTGDFIFGLAFLFLGLGTLKAMGEAMHLGEQPAVLNFFASFDPSSFSTTLLFLLIGGILTMSVQSSAAVMAITMILCSSGALPVYQGIALVMGENIGTTVTSNLAALTASTQARRAAFAHMLFNLFGVCWVLILFRPFIDMVCSLAGFDVSLTRENSTQDAFLANAAKLSVVLALFHTCFNIINTSILIWFIPQIEKIVCRVIRSGKKAGDAEEDEGVVKLEYIAGGLVQTPEIALIQAQKEIAHFGSRLDRMFGMVRSLADETNEEAFNKTFSRIEKYEGITDNMEMEIAKYLEEVGKEHLSDESKATIRSMMRQISEMESIGDACFNMGRIILRRFQSGKTFTDTLTENSHKMFDLTDKAIKQMCSIVNEEDEDPTPQETYRIEKEINTLRDKLKSDNINAINDHQYDYGLGTMYGDLVKECEKLGDYVVNVVQAKCGK